MIFSTRRGIGAGGCSDSSSTLAFSADRVPSRAASASSARRLRSAAASCSRISLAMSVGGASPAGASGLLPPESMPRIWSSFDSWPSMRASSWSMRLPGSAASSAVGSSGSGAGLAIVAPLSVLAEEAAHLRPGVQHPQPAIQRALMLLNERLGGGQLDLDAGQALLDVVEDDVNVTMPFVLVTQRFSVAICRFHCHAPIMPYTQDCHPPARKLLAGSHPRRPGKRG